MLLVESRPFSLDIARNPHLRKITARSHGPPADGMLPFYGIGRRARRPFSLLLQFLLCLPFVSAQNWGFAFPNGSDPRNTDQTFMLGEVLDIQWNTPFPIVNLAVVAQDANAFVFLTHNDSQNSFAWDVNVNCTGFTQPFFYLYLENAQVSSLIGPKTDTG
jgi:hypothetical protein